MSLKMRYLYTFVALLAAKSCVGDVIYLYQDHENCPQGYETDMCFFPEDGSCCTLGGQLLHSCSHDARGSILGYSSHPEQVRTIEDLCSINLGRDSSCFSDRYGSATGCKINTRYRSGVVYAGGLYGSGGRRLRQRDDDDTSVSGCKVADYKGIVVDGITYAIAKNSSDYTELQKQTDQDARNKFFQEHGQKYDPNTDKLDPPPQN